MGVVDQCQAPDRACCVRCALIARIRCAACAGGVRHELLDAAPRFRGPSLGSKRAVRGVPYEACGRLSGVNPLPLITTGAFGAFCAGFSTRR